MAKKAAIWKKYNYAHIMNKNTYVDKMREKKTAKAAQ